MPQSSRKTEKADEEYSLMSIVKGQWFSTTVRFLSSLRTKPMDGKKTYFLLLRQSKSVKVLIRSLLSYMCRYQNLYIDANPCSQPHSIFSDRIWTGRGDDVLLEQRIPRLLARALPQKPFLVVDTLDLVILDSITKVAEKHKFCVCDVFLVAAGSPKRPKSEQ